MIKLTVIHIIPLILAYDLYYNVFQRHPMDVSNFDSAFTQDDALLTPVDPEFLETVEQQQFKGFSFTNPNYTLPQ